MLSFALTGCGCKHEYDEGKITKEATCKEEGIKTFTCKLCDEEKTETVPLAEHTYDSWKVTKEATCTEEGEKTLHGIYRTGRVGDLPAGVRGGFLSGADHGLYRGGPDVLPETD